MLTSTVAVLFFAFAEDVGLVAAESVAVAALDDAT